jgi:hypothetical protein
MIDTFINRLRKDRMLVVALTIFAVAAICTKSAYAVVEWKNIGVYYQNFDDLINVEGVDTTWTDESTIVDWYSNKYSIRADRGVYYTPSKLMSYGSMGSTDRALGGHIYSSVPISITNGIKLFNDSADDLDSFTVRYTGEQWRAKTYTGSTTEKLRFSYAIGTSGIGIGTGLYVNQPALDFISPNLTNSGAVNGNLAANSETLTYTVTGINWRKGDYLMLRWEDYTERTGVDNDGLAIDDFYFTTSQDLNEFNVSHNGINFESVPEPSTIGLFGIVAVGALVAAKRRKTRIA